MMSGLVAAEAIHRATDATTPEGVMLWKSLLRYTGILNQAFAQILVIGAAMAIFLWSLALSESRGLKWYGITSAIATIALVGAGAIKLDIHGFGAVMILQGIWFTIAGAKLMRRGEGIRAEGDDPAGC